jgi:DNA polymerase III subunit gamma/tau
MSMNPLPNKYRPKKFTDMIGQEVVTKTLTNAFNSGNLHHAYIFEGQFGSGKTTSARILAAMENCEEGPSLEPCGVCKNCKDIFAGKSYDVKEIDAASNRGVDDVRDLKKEIANCPIYSKTKYIIFDEAHSLTGIAAEALLKSIEEPPPHVRFILCTTEAFALKPTIHSRCIVFTFNKVSWFEICEHLVSIAKKEGVDADEDALKLIAKKSKGSVRDSLQNLQFAIDFCGEEKITLDAVQQVLGVVDDSSYFELIETMMIPDVPKAMLLINQLMVKGKNAEQIIKGLEEHLRNLLTINACRQKVEGLGFTEEEIKRYAHQGKIAPPILVSFMLDMIIDIQRALTYNMDTQYQLENFVIKTLIERARQKPKPKKSQ